MALEPLYGSKNKQYLHHDSNGNGIHYCSIFINNLETEHKRFKNWLQIRM